MTRGESDEILYQRFLSERDEEALGVLLERHRNGLTLFLYGMIHDMDEAEDLMIDAFAEAASRSHWSSGGSSFKTWLFAVGRKKALMYLRKHRTAVLPLDENRPDAAALPEAEMLAEEQNRELYLGLRKLPEDYREALTLLYLEQMSYEEAAKVMGKTRKQMYHLADRGKGRLRDVLKEMGFDYAQYE